MFDRTSMFAVAAISTVAVTALTPTGAFAQRGTFDGGWIVQITTSRGTCSSGVGFGIEVRDGVMFASGLDVQGKVAANGATRVRITSGDQSASGSGRLSGNSGAGTWQGVGSQGACAEAGPRRVSNRCLPTGQVRDGIVGTESNFHT
jgi:hypothetical protein